MKRMHVLVSVDNIDTAIEFYSALFAAKPGVSFDKGARIAHAKACCEPQS